MAEKNLLNEFAGGVTGLFVGPPGTGKSLLCGSVCEMVDPSEVALICPKPNEINSANYRKYGLDKTAKVFRDHRWRPEAKMFEADGYARLMTYLYSLYEDTTKSVVILDPLTDAVTLAAHQILKAEQAATPNDLRDKLGYYSSMKSKMKDLVTTLTGLASPDLPRPKHVFVTVHAQPAKEDDIKGKATAEKEAKGISYFGDVMASLEGSYRQEIAAEFDIVGFSTIKHDVVRDGTKMTRQTRFVVQLAPDNERHAKVRLAPGLLEKELPNNMKGILEAVLAAEEKVA